MKKCKITVLKREFYPELAKEYIPFPDFGPCEMMKEGDEFITSGLWFSGQNLMKMTKNQFSEQEIL